MPKWLWWFLEPFTKPRYKLTAVDGIKATLFVVICFGIIFGTIIFGYWLEEIIKERRGK